MKPEDVKKIKCDRCGVTIGLYRHTHGHRCPSCIWNERENLIEWARCLLSSGDYTHGNKTSVIVSRKSMDALAETIKDVTNNCPLSIDSDAPVL